MPSLVCSVQNCVYNNAMYCSKGDIQVGGEEARKCQETCWQSFQERKRTARKAPWEPPSRRTCVGLQSLPLYL